MAATRRSGSPPGGLRLFLLFDGGGVMLRCRGSMYFGRVLVRLACAVASQHGGLLVGGGGATVCGTGVGMPLRRGQVSAFGSLQ